MFSFYGLDHVTIKDLTLDCNFQNRTAADPAIGDSPIRIGAFTIQANTALVKNIRIINAGARAYLPLTYRLPAGSEDFVVRALAWDWRLLPPTNSAHPFWDGAYDANSTYTIVVDGCDISQFRSLHGGYLSGIQVSSSFPNLGGSLTPVPADILAGYQASTDIHGATKLALPNPPSGQQWVWSGIADQAVNYEPNPSVYRATRDSRFGLIRHCHVAQYIAGHAINFANSIGVVAEENFAVDGDNFFNCDTGPAKNLDVRNNLALE